MDGGAEMLRSAFIVSLHIIGSQGGPMFTSALVFLGIFFISIGTVKTIIAGILYLKQKRGGRYASVT